MQLHWHTEPFLLLALLFPIWAYLLCTFSFREKWFPTEKFPVGQAIVFVSAWVIAYLTVGSPLDQLGEEYLFSAHMVQHMLLIYLVPFMLFWGTPAWLADKLLSYAWIRRPWAVLTTPVVGGFLFTFNYTIWHVPVLYEAALHDKFIHIIEHITMFITGVFMLWHVGSPSRTYLPPRPYGIKMLAMFILMIGQLPVFAFLCFSGEVLYPTYELAPRIWGIDPLQDQLHGGVIMKVTNMLISLAVLIHSFMAWYERDQKSANDAFVPVPAQKTLSS